MTASTKPVPEGQPGSSSPPPVAQPLPAPTSKTLNDNSEKKSPETSSLHTQSNGTDSYDNGDDGSPPSGSLTKYDRSRLRRFLTPKNVRWDEKSPHPLTMPLILLYAISTTFTVANLYYNQPILNRIAETFNVSYEESSQTATLLQSGYAAGIVFLLPLGDLLERRPFILSLIFLTATLWIVLCVTDDFVAFRAISFICGATTVTPQLMIPLVSDFARPDRRSASLSIVVSGLVLGMLVARFLAGVVTNFTHWRNIYWFSCGAQYLIVALLYLFMPDYPSTNPDGGLGYLGALWSILCMMVTEPVLVQSALIIFAFSAVFTSFWTTLTFLLASPPYEYSSLTIGLFSLLSLVAIVTVPLYGRVIDRFVPLFSVLLGQLIATAGVIFGVFAGLHTVAGPIIQAVAIDLGLQTLQVANRAAIFSINPKARNRVNTGYMTLGFLGQLTGTSVGNRLYAEGGWRWSGGFSIGCALLSMAFALARGPRAKGWVGWDGGWKLRRDPIMPQETRGESQEQKKEKV